MKHNKAKLNRVKCNKMRCAHTLFTDKKNRSSTLFKVLQSIDVGIWMQLLRSQGFSKLFHSDFQFKVLILASAFASHCFSTDCGSGHIFPEYRVCFLCAWMFLISTCEHQHNGHLQKQLEIKTILSSERIWRLRSLKCDNCTYLCLEIFSFWKSSVGF